MYGKFVTRCRVCYSEKKRVGALKFWRDRHANDYWKKKNKEDGLLVG